MTQTHVHHAAATGIVTQRYDDIRFRPDRLGAFLELLESAVLYDRLVDGVCGFGTPLAAKGPMNEWFPLFRVKAHSPSEDLEKHILDRLRDSGVLVEHDVEMPDLTARDLLERQIQLFPSLREYRDGIQSRGVASHWPDDEEKREIALMLTWTHNARGLYVAEAARRMPYHANRIETDALAKSESDEHRMFASVVTHLHDRLNKASARELQRIVALGGRTHFPETPIAWQILSNATCIDELFAATMQLRQEYAPFRKSMQKLDAELRSEDTCVARHVRIVEEIEAVTDDLWPAQRKGLRRSVIDSVSFVAGLPVVVPGSIPAAAFLANTILSRPIDALITGMRRRRYRVLFRAKRTFLRSKRATKKLASLFDVNEEIVRRGLSGENTDE